MADWKIGASNEQKAQEGIEQQRLLLFRAGLAGRMLPLDQEHVYSNAGIVLGADFSSQVPSTWSSAATS